jgi:hypothetical protein
MGSLFAGEPTPTFPLADPTEVPKRDPLWSDATCAVCATTLLPLTYTLPQPRDEPRDRPLLKCAGCGQRYRWRPTIGWRPVETG